MRLIQAQVRVAQAISIQSQPAHLALRLILSPLLLPVSVREFACCVYH